MEESKMSKEMKKVFVCSPLSDPSTQQVKQNIKFAEKMCQHIIEKEGDASFAPHAFYTKFLDDSVIEHRQLGIQAGLEFLRVCDKIVVYLPSTGLTSGMQTEVGLAEAVGIDVEFRPQVYDVWMEMSSKKSPVLVKRSKEDNNPILAPFLDADAATAAIYTAPGEDS